MTNIKQLIDRNSHQIHRVCNVLNIKFYCSSNGIKQTRRNTLRRHRNAGMDDTQIKSSMHRSFGGVDKNVTGLLCPLERKRNTLAFVATITEDYLQNQISNMTFATTILPQHSFTWKEFEEIPTKALTVRHKLEETIREYNHYEEADARSFGLIEMGAGLNEKGKLQ